MLLWYVCNNPVPQSRSTAAKYANCAFASQVSSQAPTRSISGDMFNEVVNHALACRKCLIKKYQGFLHFLEPTASHCGHVVEPPTVESKIPELVQTLTLDHLNIFLWTAVRRTYWEIAKDLQETELLVFQTLGQINNLSKGKPSLDNANANIIMDHFAAIAATIDAFCTRLSARLTLTPEQRVFYSENDIMDAQSLCFRLVATADLPSVEDRLRLVWAVYPIHPARGIFLDWNTALSGSNTTLKTAMETLTTAINDIETEARGTKRKADEDIQTDQ